MSKILITGASGFIGSHLTEEALAQGMKTHAGIRSTSNLRWLQNPRICLVNIDFEQPEAVGALLLRERYDYIIHCAGLTKAADVQQFYQVNGEYLKVLVRAITENNICLKKFIFVSSLAAYGPADFQPGKLVKKDSTPHPVSNYGKSKLMAENFLKSVDTIPWLMIRPTVVYGPRETELLTVFKLLNHRLELLIGQQPQSLTFIYIKDLVKAMMTCLFSDKIREAYFVTDGNLYTTAYFNGCIKNILRRKGIKITISIETLRFLARCSEIVGKITRKYPPLNQNKVHELACRSWQCETSTIPGFTPAFFLEKGLQETIKWYKANCWL